MAPITPFLLVSAAIARIAFATSVRIFPDSKCDPLGYYDTLDASQATCSRAELGDDNFETVTGNSALYKVFVELQEELDQGCAVVIGMDSPQGSQAPPCGECVTDIHTAFKCGQVNLPTPWYAWECCGSDCQKQCGKLPRKRTLEEAVEALQAKQAASNGTVPDIANLKNRSPISPTLLDKRADCKFNNNTGAYTKAGYPTQIGPAYTCNAGGSCMVTKTGTVETSFSQTFDVSETTEAGFFEVVSESVSFGYSATWEKSSSSSVSVSYTYNEGQSGYLTFSPLSSCVDGTFEGDGCGGMGIPTGGDARTACVPEKDGGGQPLGEINLVTSI